MPVPLGGYGKGSGQIEANQRVVLSFRCIPDLQGGFQCTAHGDSSKEEVFARRQGDQESMQHFAHALVVLLSRVERLSGIAETSKDLLLK